MPRIVRRASLIERIKAYLNPWDFLLWVSEELNDNEWEDFWKEWAIPLGITLNIVFMVARANSEWISRSRGDDVFGDFEAGRGSGWLIWFSSFVVHFLTLVSCLNAVYTFYRKRHYRLFENPIDFAPTTPSARRVRVDSSPLSSSPLRFLSNIINSTTAESRAHPDGTREVWEVAVWDPTPLCLRLLCLFSPGHIVVYWLFLPVAASDPRPSLTVVTTMLLTSLLSIQLTLLHTSFSQQTKDVALIQKEVLHEYDTKFVHPTLNRPVRDVGTQSRSSSAAQTKEVDTYTPTTIVNRGFRTHPNPNYARFYDPDNLSQQRNQPLPRSTTIPVLQTPTYNHEFSSPLRWRPGNAIRQPHFRQAPSAAAGTLNGDGGSLGVFSHVNSPLNKARSPNPLRPSTAGDAEFRDRAESPLKRLREGSPLKKSSTPGEIRGQLLNGVGGAGENVDLISRPDEVARADAGTAAGFRFSKAPDVRLDLTGKRRTALGGGAGAGRMGNVREGGGGGGADERERRKY